MKPDIAKKWVEALRSGKYKQATRKLCVTTEDNHPIGFCCLGVLCDLAEQEGIVDHRVEVIQAMLPIHVRSYRAAIGSGKQDTLPAEVAEWAGIRSEDGSIVYASGLYDDGAPKECRLTLVNLNDSGHSFEHIADVIEQHADRL